MKSSKSRAPSSRENSNTDDKSEVMPIMHWRKMRSRAWSLKLRASLAFAEPEGLGLQSRPPRGHSLILPLRQGLRPRRLVLGAWCLVLSSALAQYSIDWSKIAGGAGTSTGAVYSVSSAIGQPDAGGPVTNGQYSVTGGLWAF